MDKLAARLQEDAQAIEVSVTPELDARIRASLEGVAPEPARHRKPSTRQPWFWWLSSLTGVAAAIVVVAIVNWQGSEPEGSDPSVPPAAGTPATLVPPVQWRVETAVLTRPLEQEMADLQADLKKAEEALKRDIDAVF